MSNGKKAMSMAVRSTHAYICTSPKTQHSWKFSSDFINVWSVMTDLNVSLSNVPHVTSQTFLSAVPHRRLNLPSPPHACFINYRPQIWGKVMFLHLSVSHSVHRRVYTPLGRHPPLPETATEAGASHPTRMHSCYLLLQCVTEEQTNIWLVETTYAPLVCF